MIIESTARERTNLARPVRNDAVYRTSYYALNTLSFILTTAPFILTNKSDRSFDIVNRHITPDARQSSWSNWRKRLCPRTAWLPTTLLVSTSNFTKAEITIDTKTQDMKPPPVSNAHLLLLTQWARRVMTSVSKGVLNNATARHRPPASPACTPSLRKTRNRPN